MALLSVAFGALVTAHVALVLALATRPPRWRSLAALLVPFLAPYWGWQEHRRTGSAVWLIAFLLYALALLMALR